jgi:hypothetical protein
MNADLVRLIIGVIGAASVGIGAWMHYAPLGPIAFGSLLSCVAIIGAIRAGSAK